MSLKDTPIHQRYADGDVIITEGIMSNNAYVVLKGSVRITKKIDKKVNQKFHIDIFCDLKEIWFDDKIIFKKKDYVIF